MTKIAGNGRWAFFAIVCIGILVYAYHRNSGVFHNGPPADNSDAIALNIGALKCSSSGYYLTSRLDDSKLVIYDCQMPSGNYKCVTESGGIDTDSTAEVKLVFENTLGSTKPLCIS